MNEMLPPAVADAQQALPSCVEAPATPGNELLNEIALFKDTFIRHPDVEAGWDQLTDLLLSGAQPSGAECVVVSGPKRSGKTTLLKRFAHEVNSQVAEASAAAMDKGSIRFREQRVVVVETPSGATLKTLAESTLCQLGDPAPGGGSTASKMLRAYTLLRKRGVRVLVFEEFQHLIDRDKRTRSQIANKAADFVKSILNEGICGVVLSGMPEVEDILAVNPQLEARCMGMVRMRALGFETAEERKLFRFCLMQFELSLPLPCAFRLTDMDVAARMHVASGGLLGLVAHILANSVRTARREGKDALSLDLIARTFARMPIARNHRVNPFMERTSTGPDEHAAEPGRAPRAPRKAG